MKTFKRIYSFLNELVPPTIDRCVGRDNPAFGVSMADSIQFFAKNSGLGYGLAIIIVTLIVRLDYFPHWELSVLKRSYSSVRR